MKFQPLVEDKIMKRFDAKNFIVANCYCRENYLCEDIIYELLGLPEKVTKKEISKIIDNYKELSEFIKFTCLSCGKSFTECQCENSICETYYDSNYVCDCCDNILVYDDFYEFDGVLFCNENCFINFLKDNFPELENVKFIDFSIGYRKHCSFEITLNNVRKYYDLEFYKKIEELKSEIEKNHRL